MPKVKLANVRSVRDALDVSQSEAATLLGVSTKAVQSYEQGFRSVPQHVQKTAALLLYLRWRSKHAKHSPCWALKHCGSVARAGCPSFQNKAGDLCWMLTGTLCRGAKKASRAAKLDECQKCAVMRRWLTY